MSTMKRTPKWAMGGRGEEKVIDFFMVTRVRARILSSRPVPATAPNPENYPTHRIEYIVGGRGQEWAIIDERRQTIRMKAAVRRHVDEVEFPAEGEALSPPGSPLGAAAGEGAGPEELPVVEAEASVASEPTLVAPPGWWIARYTVLEPARRLEPAPGQYGIVNVDCRFQKSASAVFERPSSMSQVVHAKDQPTFEKKLKELERRDHARRVMEESRCSGPDSTLYSVHTSWNQVAPNRKRPNTGFGSAPRTNFATVREGPEPGAYKPRNCWDGKQVSMRSRVGGAVKSLQEYRAASAPGLDPLAYDASRSFRAVVCPKEPKWNIRCTSERSELVTSTAPGPGTYNANYKQVLTRQPVMTYTKRAHQSILHRPLAETWAPNYTMFIS